MKIQDPQDRSDHLDRAYASGFAAKCAECGVDPSALEKAAKLDPADLMRFLPMVGGGLHGVAKPERGASRGETGVFEGAAGAAGGTAGLIGGIGIGDALLRRYGIEDPNMDILKMIGLLGSSLGTAVGTIPGRALASRDIPERKELDDLAKALEEARKSGTGTVINVGTNPSSGTPIEADKESGEEAADTKET